MEKILEIYNSFLSSYWGLISITAIIVKTIYDIYVNIKKKLAKDVKIKIKQFRLKTEGEKITEIIIQSEYSKITDNEVVIKHVYIELPIKYEYTDPENSVEVSESKKIPIYNYDDHITPFNLNDYKKVGITLDDSELNSKLLGKKIRLVLVDKRNKKFKSNRLKIKSGRLL